MSTTHTSIYTPSLSSRTSPLSCSGLAHITFTSFSKLSTESRHLVSLILQSVYEYTDAGSRGLIGDDDLKLVSTWSDLLMAVASRLEVDLKNKAWSGDLLTDVRRMYHSIIFKLIGLLIEAAGDGALAAINVVRSALVHTRHYLATSTTRTLERDIANTTCKYGISYTREAKIEDDEVDMPSGPYGPMVDEVRAVKMKSGLKFRIKSLWRKRRCEDESECVGSCEADSRSASDGETSDSGVSMGESDSDDDECGWDEEVGLAL